MMILSTHSRNGNLDILWPECYYRGISYYSVSQKNPPPLRFSDIFPKRMGIFNQFFTHLSHVPFYTRLQIFIQLSNFDEVMSY